MAARESGRLFTGGDGLSARGIAESPKVLQKKAGGRPCHRRLRRKGVSVLRQFYVTCRVEKWYVDEGTESHGPYLSRHDAIADAVEAAKLLAKPKKPIEVILKIRGSEAELVWSSRKSFVPVPQFFAADDRRLVEEVAR